MLIYNPLNYLELLNQYKKSKKCKINSALFVYSLVKTPFCHACTLFMLSVLRSGFKKMANVLCVESALQSKIFNTFNE